MTCHPGRFFRSAGSQIHSRQHLATSYVTRLRSQQGIQLGLRTGKVTRLVIRQRRQVHTRQMVGRHVEYGRQLLQSHFCIATGDRNACLRIVDARLVGNNSIQLIQFAGRLLVFFLLYQHSHQTQAVFKPEVI